jgi:hypothetical protein
VGRTCSKKLTIKMLLAYEIVRVSGWKVGLSFTPGGPVRINLLAEVNLGY